MAAGGQRIVQAGQVTAIGSPTLYTVPAGQTLYVKFAQIVCIAITAGTTTPTNIALLADGTSFLRGMPAANTPVAFPEGSEMIAGSTISLSAINVTFNAGGAVQWLFFGDLE